MASESESEKRETLADIVAEMRTRSREVKMTFAGWLLAPAAERKKEGKGDGAR